MYNVVGWVVSVVVVVVGLAYINNDTPDAPSVDLTESSSAYVTMCSSIDARTHLDYAMIGCMARLRGFVDGHTSTSLSLQVSPHWCVPQSETDGDVLSKVLAWVEQHPVVLKPHPSVDQATSTLLIANRALADIYPCTTL